MNRQSRALIAHETLDICKSGAYTGASGQRVSIARALDEARDGTRLYTPRQLQDALYNPAPIDDEAPRVTISLHAETTMEAARRLCQDARDDEVLILNFASARNPGGGFLGGSQAQEEALSRSSGLYPCLLEAPEYYEFHRGLRSCLYSHRMVYSPGVPFFRDDDGALLDEPYRVAVITAPAVNAGVVRRKESRAGPKIREEMQERITLLLGLAHHRRHRRLILGAWGCGVFRNDPQLIAELFADALRGDRFERAFEQAVFAIPGRTKGSRNLKAFEQVFGAARYPASSSRR